MNDELEKQLYDEYPQLFRLVNLTESEKENYEALPPITAFGIECGDGWFDIIDSLCDYLEGLNGKDDANIEVHQIKEKFGGLRFYTGGYPPSAGGAIRVAEKISFRTCERCGDVGKQRRNSWIRTLCDECNDEVISERRELIEGRIPPHLRDDEN